MIVFFLQHFKLSQEEIIVVIVKENLLLIDSSIEDMVEGILKYKSCSSGHILKVCSFWSVLSRYSRTVPVRHEVRREEIRYNRKHVAES